MTSTAPFYSNSNMRELERRARGMDARQNVAKPELLEPEEPAHENAIPSRRSSILLHHDCH
jgi:hypothetical protein